MNAETPSWVAVARLDDIPAQGARKLHWRGLVVALVRTAEGRVFAVEDKCPHKGGPLSDGMVHGDCITCPLHNWVISLETGAVQGADTGSTRCFAVRLEGETIYLQG